MKVDAITYERMKWRFVNRVALANARAEGAKHDFKWWKEQIQWFADNEGFWDTDGNIVEKDDGETSESI